MPLCDYVPAALTNRARIERLHADRAATEQGRRGCDNFAACLDSGLLERPLFERSCRRLVELLPDPPNDVDEGRVAPGRQAEQPALCAHFGDRLARNAKELLDGRPCERLALGK